VVDLDDILLISDDGTIIRMAARDISIYSRGTQGVRLMRMGDGSKVISVARTEHLEEEDEAFDVGDGDPDAQPSADNPDASAPTETEAVPHEED